MMSKRICYLPGLVLVLLIGSCSDETTTILATMPEATSTPMASMPTPTATPLPPPTSTPAPLPTPSPAESPTDTATLLSAFPELSLAGEIRISVEDPNFSVFDFTVPGDPVIVTFMLVSRDDQFSRYQVTDPGSFNVDLAGNSTLHIPGINQTCVIVESLAFGPQEINRARTC